MLKRIKCDNKKKTVKFEDKMFKITPRYEDNLIPIAKVGNGKKFQYLNIDTTNKYRKGEQYKPYNDNLIYPIMSDENINRILIVGPTLCGKSTFIKNLLINSDLEIPIYIFSKVKNDPSLDELKDIFEVHEIDVEGDFYDRIDEQELEYYANSICIFDDIDTFANEKISKAVNKFRDKILETGRHHHIKCISTSHFLLNYQKTRQLILEVDMVVAFIQTAVRGQFVDYLKSKQGLNKNTIAHIIDTNDRWVGYHSNYPNFFITSSKAEIL